MSWIWIHESDFKGFFLEKRLWKGFSIKCSNSGMDESTPQTQSNVIWISSKAELEISFFNSLLEKWVWESGPKIDPDTCVTARSVEDETRNAEWRGDFSQLQIQIIPKSQFEIVPQDTSEFKSNQNLNSTLYREIPRILIFSILTSWLKSPFHSGFRLPFNSNSAFRVSSWPHLPRIGLSARTNQSFMFPYR